MAAFAAISVAAAAAVCVVFRWGCVAVVAPLDAAMTLAFSVSIAAFLAAAAAAASKVRFSSASALRRRVRSVP